MPHGGYHGVVKMGGVTVQQGSQSDGQGGQTGGGVYNPGGYANNFDTGQAGDASDILDKGLSPTNPKDAEIINALNVQEETPVVDKKEITGLPSGGILQALYGGGAGSIEGYDPENTQYNLEGQHPLSQQFVRLADKYYGGDQEAFAQSSQGQVLLNYLQDVPYTKGGLLGLMDEETKEKVINLANDPTLSGFPVSSDVLYGDDPNPFKTKNMPISDIRMQPDLNRLGPLTSDEYKKFNEYLYATRPDLYAQARPFSSGKLPASVIKFLMSPTTEFGKGIANSLLNLAGKDPLKEKEPFKGIATDPATNQFIGELIDGNDPTLDSSLLNLIQPLDQGGINDVAQAVINQNETPGMKTDNEDNSGILAQLILDQLPEGGINVLNNNAPIFDPNSLAFSIG
tara:strand:+ start:48 stop:1244 length:1197 start_codon:yes stop_codon:yes gene_type:complete